MTVFETGRPDPPPVENFQLPPPNIVGGNRFESPFVNKFESIYLEYFLPIYEIISAEQNETAAVDKDKDKDDDIVHTQLDSTVTPLLAAREYYQELIGMEL